jgi:L-lactate dehydrogenase complex protein LldE
MQVEGCGATFAGKIGYHPSCHLARELGVVDEPRRLITHVAGAELVPMDFAEQCCGFGGTFAVKYPQISDAMLQKKILGLKRAGAETLVSCDAGCLLQLAGRLHRLGESVRVMHLAELLNASTSREEGHDAPGS